MNSHLNLFRFFNESTGEEFLENNLSRAFAICLLNDSLFLNEYLQAVLTAEDFQYLFSYISKDTRCSVNLQVDTATIEKESFKTVYAIAMTANRGLNMDGFMNQFGSGEKKNITDVFIAIKDIAILIEVKRNGEDCRAQLYGQVRPFLETAKDGKIKFEIRSGSYSWPQVLHLMEKVMHLQQISGHHAVFMHDFIALSRLRYPHWFEPKPFHAVPFSAEADTPDHIQLINRMRQAIAGIAEVAGPEYLPLPYADRLGICLPFGWASELIPQFAAYANDPVKYVVFDIWPANTKTQGYQVYNKSLDWLKKDTIHFGGKDFKLEIAYEIKLSHFNRYITSIYYTDEAIASPTHTDDNFYHVSGKWKRDSWAELEAFLDAHFKPVFNWRTNCKWEEKFVNTDRSYLTMSLGFVIHAFVPFTEFSEIDRKEEDIVSVTKYLAQVIEAFKGLIS